MLINSPTPSKLYSLQLLRFVAALFVLLFHLELMNSGYKGVDLFFVISGFVMYYSTLIVTHKSAKRYFINRLTKIYILYWFVLLVLYFIQPYIIDIRFFKTLFLLPNHFPVLKVSWSLSYELYFYFLFGVIVYLLNKKYYNYVFLVLLAASTFVTFLNVTSYTLKGASLNFLFGQNFWEFMLGIFCCFMVTRNTIPPVIAILGGIISGLAITFLTIDYATPLSYIVYGALSFCLVSFAVFYEKRAGIGKRWAGLWQLLGDASYAMYLTAPVITIVLAPETLLSKIATIIIVITVSILIHRFIENNLLIRVRKYLLRRIK